MAGSDAAAVGVGSTVGGVRELVVLYDHDCALCRRCRAWLETQRTWVRLRFVEATAEQARARRVDLPWLGADLIVVGDSGQVWVGPAAFLMCLWATVTYRPWSYRLSGRSFAPMAERFFHTISANRTALGRVVGSDECPDGQCRHRVSGDASSLPPPGWPHADRVERLEALRRAQYEAARSWSS